ncbi:Palmitoyltransferase ZDHHC16A [Labeo rohita]|uniref:Palmitoyltransferase ZDHHC16A n=1 Tax=Labeo rohita TaxID=84645 RepID=A0ABQ8M4T9_LABRO|nr:Palmitoyltransferase ZDHHC16A [Labeo rohita]
MRPCSSVMHLLLRCLRGCGRHGRSHMPRRLRQPVSYIKLIFKSLYFNSLTNSEVVLDCILEPVFWMVEVVTRWFGMVFVFLVVALTSSVVFIAYFCLLPLVLYTYSPGWMMWHICYGHWNLVMIVFHYYKATNTPPGYPPKQFRHLEAEKQGVPVTGIGLLIGIVPSEGVAGKGVQEVSQPPYTYKDRMFHKSVIYMWVLTSTVAVALGGLTLWHAVLITRGETSIERHINNKEAKRLAKRGRVYRNPFSYGKLNNWKVFFGVEKRSHWLTRVLLPSGHTPYGDGLTWDIYPFKKDMMPV